MSYVIAPAGVVTLSNEVSERASSYSPPGGRPGHDRPVTTATPLWRRGQRGSEAFGSAPRLDAQSCTSGDREDPPSRQRIDRLSIDIGRG
jgi:hypothetical protein